MELPKIINIFLKTESHDVSEYLGELAKAFGCSEKDCIHEINLHTDTDKHIDLYVDSLINGNDISKMKPIISYFVDELICNVQQHAGVDKAYGIGYVNKKENHLFIGIADGGRTIFGSYIKAQKYLEMIDNNEANSLYLAHKGYSTKNLPNAENRGYGISSNSKIVVNGLSGAFAIVSGNAMSYKDSNNNTYYELPGTIEFPGTMVIAEIPITVNTINLYDYIS